MTLNRVKGIAAPKAAEILKKRFEEFPNWCKPIREVPLEEGGTLFEWVPWIKWNPDSEDLGLSNEFKQLNSEECCANPEYAYSIISISEEDIVAYYCNDSGKERYGGFEVRWEFYTPYEHKLFK